MCVLLHSIGHVRHSIRLLASSTYLIPADAAGRWNVSCIATFTLIVLYQTQGDWFVLLVFLTYKLILSMLTVIEPQ